VQAEQKIRVLTMDIEDAKADLSTCHNRMERLVSFLFFIHSLSSRLDAHTVCHSLPEQSTTRGTKQGGRGFRECAYTCCVFDLVLFHVLVFVIALSWIV
jgi:hypothetical protein